MSDASRDPATKPPRGTEARRAVMTAGIVIVLLVAVVGVYAWAMLGTSAMSAQGYVALALGIVATLGLGVGLMALVFFSNRYGYDERAGRSGKDGGGGRVG